GFPIAGNSDVINLVVVNLVTKQSLNWFSGRHVPNFNLVGFAFVSAGNSFSAIKEGAQRGYILLLFPVKALFSGFGVPTNDFLVRNYDQSISFGRKKEPSHKGAQAAVLLFQFPQLLAGGQIDQNNAARELRDISAELPVGRNRCRQYRS